MWLSKYYKGNNYNLFKLVTDFNINKKYVKYVTHMRWTDTFATNYGSVRKYSPLTFHVKYC